MLTLDLLQQQNISIGMGQRVAHFMQDKLPVAGIKTLVNIVSQDTELVFSHAVSSRMVKLYSSIFGRPVI